MPADYRTSYEFLGSWAVADEPGRSPSQIHVIYTSPGTITAYLKHHRFPDGSVLVKEVYQATTRPMKTGVVSRADKSTLLGGGLGAATGAIIGAAVGAPGAGAAIGGALGGVGGFVAGNYIQNQKSAERRTQSQLQTQQAEIERQRREIEQLKVQSQTE